jgi:sugar porter (SP) family MFS transporter
VKPAIRPLLVIGLALAIFQQFVGINTVIYYAPTILKDTGLTNSASITQTVFIGVTNVVFTIVALLLLDRVGRRKLLITGTVGLVVGLAILGAYFASSTLQHDAPYLALVGLLLFIAAFAVGLGPVVWLLISEIFPLGVRSKGMSVSTVANWGANFLVAATFLSLSKAITRQGIFFLYAGIGVIAVIVFAWKVPETKDRTLEDIQEDLVGDDAAEDETTGTASA